MTSIVGGEVITANRDDIFIATCWKCERLLGSSNESPEKLSTLEKEHLLETRHIVWIGAVTVGPMVEWLEKLLIEQGLRREE